MLIQKQCKKQFFFGNLERFEKNYAFIIEEAEKLF